ncbi:unnamed protein product [Bursaphelenchus xylophilus]|uniref:(pine wood nematode) hypothetical protein n=1 Tax=Bursaphelenchus xylophilus TaxID=6326 RepID=A0A1I7S1I9_BURXY|nr:unnamed protein product [Bursaphelenchus xylophilus]CAG9081432.1 unnamed protein product [Bursaphelenchus xylophilus]
MNHLILELSSCLLLGSWRFENSSVATSDSARGPDLRPRRPSISQLVDPGTHGGGQRLPRLRSWLLAPALSGSGSFVCNKAPSLVAYDLAAKTLGV